MKRYRRPLYFFCCLLALSVVIVLAIMTLRVSHHASVRPPQHVYLSDMGNFAILDRHQLLILDFGNINDWTKPQVVGPLRQLTPTTFVAGDSAYYNGSITLKRRRCPHGTRQCTVTVYYYIVLSNDALLTSPNNELPISHR